MNKGHIFTKNVNRGGGPVYEPFTQYAKKLVGGWRHLMIYQKLIIGGHKQKSCCKTVQTNEDHKHTL